MKVLFASSEAYPFAMSGGLADVAGALPKALRKRLVGCRIVMPLYSCIPDELREAAFIDGCSNTRFFFMFVIPLSKAIIAVISLYIAVAHWNNYYNALVYTTNTKLHPLQLYLRQLLLVTMSTDSVDDPDALKEIQDMILTIRYAVIVISTLPIMCLYPFLQKYFVQGVMIGSLKG